MHFLASVEIYAMVALYYLQEGRTILLQRNTTAAVRSSGQYSVLGNKLQARAAVWSPETEARLDGLGSSDVRHKDSIRRNWCSSSIDSSQGTACVTFSLLRCSIQSERHAPKRGDNITYADTSMINSKTAALAIICMWRQTIHKRSWLLVQIRCVQVLAFEYSLNVFERVSLRN